MGMHNSQNVIKTKKKIVVRVSQSNNSNNETTNTTNKRTKSTIAVDPQHLKDKEYDIVLIRNYCSTISI